MAVDQVGNAIPSPGFFQGPSSTDDELMWSMVGYTQKGGTLKAGQGLLLLGTVMGQITATKRWVAYASGASDGSQVPRGILRSNVETGTDTAGHEFQGNIVQGGFVKLSKCVGLDSNAITVLKGRSDSVQNYFRF